MTKAITIVLACAALAIPASAVAGNGNGNGKANKGKSAIAKQCVAQMKADKAAFKAMYGKHAMKKCKKQGAGGIEDPEAVENAAQQCRAERDADPELFRQTWGTNTPNPKSKGAKKNAFGKCVSATAKELDEEALEEPAPTE